MYQQVSASDSQRSGGEGGPVNTVSAEETKMAKPTFSRNHKSSASLVSDGIMFLGGALVALLFVWSLWSFSTPIQNSTTRDFSHSNDFDDSEQHGFNLKFDPLEPNFYDDPELTYTMEGKIQDWDHKRQEWLNHHQSFKTGSKNRVLLVSGSQPTPCKNPIGDHFLLRFFKNKVDYCRIHGYDIFYNNVLLQPQMFTFWAKYPVVRAAMIAHPEAEWIWWVDSDAAFTDMDFKLPLERYANHNLVVHGWEKVVREKKSWVGINAGIFLIRNCQWSLDFMEQWAGMGPQSPDYDKWGEIQRSIFRDKIFPESDDQTALSYLILKGEKRWTDKIYMEYEYYFEGYWIEIVGILDHVTERYDEVERKVRKLRRRHAEKVQETYGDALKQELRSMGIDPVGFTKEGSWRRPFITHFTGCQPCNGHHNQLYTGNSCWDGMNRALNFADNQVLRNFGFFRPDLLNTSTVSPLPFDHPA